MLYRTWSSRPRPEVPSRVPDRGGLPARARSGVIIRSASCNGTGQRRRIVKPPTAFIAFLLDKTRQQRAMIFGFRPADPSLPLAAPIDAAHGVDPASRRPRWKCPIPRTPSYAGPVEQVRSTRGSCSPWRLGQHEGGDKSGGAERARRVRRGAWRCRFDLARHLQQPGDLGTPMAPVVQSRARC